MNEREDRTDVRGLLLLSAAIVALLRLTGETGQTFQAGAHLFVGGLIGLAIGNRDRRFHLGLAIGLSLIELFAFVRGHFS